MEGITAIYVLSTKSYKNKVKSSMDKSPGSHSSTQKKARKVLSGLRRGKEEATMAGIIKKKSLPTEDNFFGPLER